MICVEKIGDIRRAYFEQGRTIKEIVRTLSVSHETVRKVGSDLTTHPKTTATAAAGMAFKGIGGPGRDARFGGAKLPYPTP